MLPLRRRCDAYQTLPRFRTGLHADEHGIFRQQVFCTVGPFNRGNAIPLQVLVESKRQHLVRSVESIEIDVRQVAVAAILVDDSERGARDSPPDTKSTRHSLDKTGLAAPELSAECDGGATGKGGYEPTGNCPGLFRRTGNVCVRIHRGLRLIPCWKSADSLRVRGASAPRRHC